MILQDKKSPITDWSQKLHHQVHQQGQGWFNFFSQSEPLIYVLYKQDTVPVLYTMMPERQQRIYNETEIFGKSGNIFVCF